MYGQRDGSTFFNCKENVPMVVSSSSNGLSAESAAREVASPEPFLKKITECEKVCLFGTNGKNGWKCLWCNTEWRSFNATKALHHLAKVPINGMQVGCNSQVFMFVQYDIFSNCYC